MCLENHPLTHPSRSKTCSPQLLSRPTPPFSSLTSNRASRKTRRHQSSEGLGNLPKSTSWELAVLGGEDEDLLVEQSDGPAVSVQDRASEGGMGLAGVARKGRGFMGPQGWRADRPWQQAKGWVSTLPRISRLEGY